MRPVNTPKRSRPRYGFARPQILNRNAIILSGRVCGLPITEASSLSGLVEASSPNLPANHGRNPCRLDACEAGGPVRAPAGEGAMVGAGTGNGQGLVARTLRQPGLIILLFPDEG